MNVDVVWDFRGGIGHSLQITTTSSTLPALKGAHRPQILVKSDAASEITAAVRQLGWLPEPSLQNRFPHNAVLERWIGTLKSTVRAAMLQSGFPELRADWAVPYSAMSLAIIQPCPIHTHERD